MFYDLRDDFVDFMHEKLDGYIIELVSSDNERL